MALSFAVIFVGAALQGPPESGTTTPPGQALTRPQTLASIAGQVLGAAAMCESIDSPRIYAAAEKIGQIVEDSTADDKELTKAKTLFKRGVADGSHSVSIGESDCAAVETDFVAMERRITR
jgi:hypothetical protein